MACCLTAPKPLPEPMLTCYQQSLVTFTWGQIHMKCSRYLPLMWVWKLVMYSRILNNRIYTGIYFEKIFRPIRPYLSLYAYLKFTIPPYTNFIQVYTFSVGWKSEQTCEIPGENPRRKSRSRNPIKANLTPWLCGQLALILLKTHIFITKVTSPHGQSNISSILVTISSTESCIFSKHKARKHNGNPPGQHVHRRPLTLHYLWIVKISWYSSH